MHKTISSISVICCRWQSSK